MKSKTARPGADPTGRQHPHPEILLDFCAKMGRAVGRHYVFRTAEMIKEKFPGSADALIPKLRAIYKASPDK